MNNCLYVCMFGGFSLSWLGTRLAGEEKSSETQFNYLIQMLLHNREKGVSRDALEAVLFEDREINDIHHATRSVIYNTKKKLKALGLPDVNYIRQKKGIYYWTEEIPVVEDAAEFEWIIQEAEARQDPDEKLALYQEACHRYTGEFLPAQAGVLWVAQEAKRYRSLFYSCVEKTVELLRANRDFLQMEEIGIYAAKVQPLADWEMVTMEAMIALGRYEEAEKFYEETVDLYFRRAGVHPSRRQKELFGKLGEQFGHRHNALEEIQTELAESEEEERGGYLCPYPVFQGIYRMVSRMMERGGQSVYLMLCIVVDSKGNPMREGNTLEELSQRLGDAILHSVRHSDAISKYGKGRYLVLLVNTTHENCSIIQKRINEKFIVGRQRTGIKYCVKSVICSLEKGSSTAGKEKK